MTAAEPSAPPAPAAPQQAARRDIDFEELLGGRLLAWVGGLAVLLGIVFFVAMAVRRGWIGEELRVVLAFLGSGALVGVGLYLFISQGRTQASLAAVASGLAGLYASDVAATRLYDLVSPVVGLACAGIVGVLGTAIAIRWRMELRPLVAGNLFAERSNPAYEPPKDTRSFLERNPRLVEGSLALVALALGVGGFFALRRRA